VGPGGPIVGRPDSRLMPRVLPEYKAQAKARILAAGFAVFQQKGFRGTTMDDIAAAVGVSKGDLYLYFPSKVDLLKEVQLSGQQRVREVLHEAFQRRDTVNALVRVFDREFAAFDDPKIWSLWLEVMSEATLDPRLAEVLRADHRKDLEVLRGLLVELRSTGAIPAGPPLDDLARAVLLVFQGAAVQLSLGVAPADTRQALRIAFRAVLGTGRRPGGRTVRRRRAARPPK